LERQLTCITPIFVEYEKERINENAYRQRDS